MLALPFDMNKLQKRSVKIKLRQTHHRKCILEIQLSKKFWESKPMSKYSALRPGIVLSHKANTYIMDMWKNLTN
ncbi:hypothetical protein BKI52_34945 [marine bacterium AO1-C]|nr:hypothetical protein BKI52_34945 [marine bacterium AO1-C]